MKIKGIFKLLVLAVVFLLALLLIDGFRPSLAENPQLSTVVFTVG